MARQSKLASASLALLGALLASMAQAASPSDTPPVPFAAPPPSPFDDLIAPKPGNSACFTRVYDAAHLRKHPKQTTTSIEIWLAYDKAFGNPPVLSPPGLGIAISQRGGSDPLFASGGCNWDEGVNRTVQNRRMIENFKKSVGISCMMLARPDVFDVSSAEEGGYLILDRGADKDTLMVYLDTGLTMVKRADRAKQLDINFGADDRVFKLHRSAAKDCAAVEDAVTTPEPTAPRR
jgi:hypothetical protein